MNPKTHVYFSLGANLGDRESNLAEALNRMGTRVDVGRVSATYETEPVGYTEQPSFLNICCDGWTRLGPDELCRFLKQIEADMGRDLDAVLRYGPRPIDIDVLFYGDQVFETEHLTIPHPEVENRAFVLAPLVDIAADLVHPKLGKTVGELFRSIGENGAVRLAHGLLSGFRRDLQDEAPRVSVGLDRVGLTAVERLICLGSTGRAVRMPASMELWIDLAATAKGAHMSRLGLAVDEAIEDGIQKTTAPTIEDLCANIAQDLLKTQGAERVQVNITARFPVTRRTPVSGLPSQELYKLLGVAAATRERTVRLVGVEAEGMTACPCAQDMMQERAEKRLLEEGIDAETVRRVMELVPMPTHNQTGIGRLMIGAHPDVRAEDLVHIVEMAMSSENYEILKRPDECFVVSRAHRNPKFVEDVARDMLANVANRYPDLPDETFVLVRQTNLESIHKHNVFAERGALLGDVRRELAGDVMRTHSMTVQQWLDRALRA